MIFFHGTSEDFLKDIKKNGLRDVTSDEWLVEVTGRKFCCVASKPNAGEGGSPSYFAVRGARERNSDGYLVVIDIEENTDKVIAIFNNKTLDDYVRYHFFVREEFRKKGYELFQAWQQNSPRKFDLDLSKYRIATNDPIIVAPEDQRGYYKDLRKNQERYIYSIFGIEFSDDFVDFIKHVGLGKPFFTLLQLHFGNLEEKKYQEFLQKPHNKVEYWKDFYETFPLNIEEEKWRYIDHWFSPTWLEMRKEQKATRNSQLLITSVSAENIVGFIHIATPSGLIKKFRPSKSKGASYSQQVWKEVFQMIGK